MTQRIFQPDIERTANERPVDGDTYMWRIKSRDSGFGSKWVLVVDYRGEEDRWASDIEFIIFKRTH